MKTVLRFDRGSLRKPEKTPQGFLRVDGIASRTGVFEYRNDNGSIRRELRLPEDVFAQQALNGFEGAPLTDGHPDEAVTMSNVKRYEVGTVTGPARRDGDFVAATIMVKDPKVIAKLERGDTGLSVGYAVDLDETPGNHPVFGRYDAIQRNIVINHLAVGVQPRAGERARVRMDSAHEIDPQHMRTEANVMADQTDKQRADELEGLNTQHVKRIAELEALVAANATAADSDALKAEKTRNDEQAATIANFKSTFDDAVRERAALVAKAAAVMGPTYRMDDMSDHLIHVAVVNRLDSTANAAAGTNPDVLRGQFLALVGKDAVNVAAKARVSELMSRNQTESRNDEATERAARLDAYRNQWRTSAVTAKGAR